MKWSKLCHRKSSGGLSFRDFRDFNLAMLGKQCWRILTRTKSLINQMLKAKYFPMVNFLDAPLGNNPSFTWRSIWEAKLVVAAGAHWKLGARSKINITGQPWLNDNDNPYITSDNPSIHEATVNSLMCMTSKQ